LWLESYEFRAAALWLVRMRWEVAAATVAAFAVWSWRRPLRVAWLEQLARIGAVSGLLVTLVSPLTLLGALTAPSTAVTHDSKGPASHLPDIVLLTIDTLAANHASLYGYSRPTTPRLDELAKHANVFERFYANSNFTASSINSIVNGSRPWTHRVLQNAAQVDPKFANEGLVARLKNAGYQTLAVATNSNAAPFHNRTDAWFDRAVYGQIHSVSAYVISIFGPRFPHAFHSLYLALSLGSWGFADRMIVHGGLWAQADHFDPEIAFSAARRLIGERDRAKPMFLWIHLLPPHDPYATPAPFVGRFDSGLHARTRFDSSPSGLFAAGLDKDFPTRYVGRYDEAIAYVDHHIGLFIDWLKQRRSYDQTLLVVTADHGESFSHSYGGHGGPMLYDDLIRVPLIIKEPGQTNGRRVTPLSEQIDLMPTVLDLAGIPIEGSVEGRSLEPVLQGEKLDRPVFSMIFEQSNRFGVLHTGSVAMIEGRWKYVRYRGQSKYPYMPKLEDLLYDLQADPGENSNLIAIEPIIASRMRAAIEEKLRVHGEPVK